MTQWKEEDQTEREEEERRRMGRRWTDDPMDVDDIIRKRVRMTRMIQKRSKH